MKIKTINKILTIILICQVLFLVFFFWIFPCFITEETDVQRETILTYMEQNIFEGMSIDECKEILGEPFLDEGSEVYFGGGYDLGENLFATSYEEYELRMFLDEAGYVDSVWYYCTLDLKY